MLRVQTHVSPHEMLQAVVLCSEKKFQITKQGNSIDFLQWLLNALHQGLNGTQKMSSSIIYRTFRGRMRVYTRKVLPVEASEMERQRLQNQEEYRGASIALNIEPNELVCARRAR